MASATRVSCVSFSRTRASKEIAATGSSVNRAACHLPDHRRYQRQSLTRRHNRVLLLAQSRQRSPTKAVASPRGVYFGHSLGGNEGGMIALHHHDPLRSQGDEKDFARRGLCLFQITKEGNSFLLIEEEVICHRHHLPRNISLLLDEDEVGSGRQSSHPALAASPQKGQLPHWIAQGGDMDEGNVTEIGWQ